jgi:hypothetical protein
MGFNVGGPTAWKVVSRGSIAAAYHWIKGEPAMVLFPTKGRMVMRGCVPYALPLSRAHELVKDGSHGVVVDSAVLWTMARKATEVMGFGNDAQVAMKVADVILNGLDDLCDMPPEPALLAAKREPAPTGEIAITVDGDQVFQGEA